MWSRGLSWTWKTRQLVKADSRAERRALVEREAPILPVSRQCRLLSVSRASLYRRPAQVTEEDCTTEPGLRIGASVEPAGVDPTGNST